MEPKQGNFDIGCSPNFMLFSSLLEFLSSLDTPPSPLSCHALQLAGTLKTGRQASVRDQAQPNLDLDAVLDAPLHRCDWTLALELTTLLATCSSSTSFLLSETYGSFANKLLTVVSSSGRKVSEGGKGVQRYLVDLLVLSDLILLCIICCFMPSSQVPQKGCWCSTGSAGVVRHMSSSLQECIHSCVVD